MRLLEEKEPEASSDGVAKRVIYQLVTFGCDDGAGLPTL